MPYKIIAFDGGYAINKDNMSIPKAEGNRDYIQFIQDIALGNDTVEGPDVVEPSYVELRQAEYPTMAEQLDMQYWDSVNGTTVWADTIQAVKDKYPTTITGGVTVGEVPAWVQEEADAWLFAKQKADYAQAVERLAEYALAEGRPEIKETLVIDQVQASDENGTFLFDEQGMPVMQDVTEEVVVQTAIEPLSATVTQTDVEGNTTEVANPEIVRDNAERAEAQAVVDATPQAVIDAYNQENV